ncbi:maleylpyruvate isomerase family mycothiol-dependent enzyme [Actinoplanes rectilineatus]|uniref:maleylpyruvate isomerase family mycothiol-dependent enzyme n=1 Tax=Actinoplanes rectilineatus TaxID=113571 RepID=UPI001B80D031|nr:maleylpyruvate isomerase family mycothiol-dependent enzyme [Actinoplanes rectilineatus]
MEIRAMIADERLRLADLVDTLTPEQWAHPSLCGEWTVGEVIGHLVAAVAAPRSWLLPAAVRNGFSIHRTNAAIAQRMAARGQDVMARELRANAENPFQPPIVGYGGPFTDLLIHGQDIRRPLGLPHALLPERMRVGLDFLVGGRAVGFTPRKRVAGLRFEAIDLGWSWGSGPVVRGDAEPLMLGLTGRTIVLPELSGDGLPELRRRLGVA